MKSDKIIIVDDDKELCQLIKEIFNDRGYNSDYAFSGASAISLMKKNSYSIALIDVRLPDMNGLILIEKLKKINIEISVIVMTGYANVQLAVKSIQAGADDFIEKPMDMHRLILSVNGIMEKHRLKNDMSGLIKEVGEKYAILGESEKTLKMRRIIDDVAPSSSPVLITGETGSGKELVARNLHIRSKRSAKPFMKINCAALPENLIESELFGYKRGAFTGAFESKTGIFETGDTGSVFLDEIGDMSISAQAKVLRVLESGEITKIGSVKEFKVDVRIICATNSDLDKFVEEKRFRKDLLHRINVITINVPPLRERRGDIPFLSEHFIKQFCINSEIPEKKIGKSALTMLVNMNWPGNIRQLKHLMEKCAILVKEKNITSDHIEEFMDIGVKNGDQDYYSAKDFSEAKSVFEKEYIMSALRKNNWQIKRTAESLGMDRTTLFRKMKQHMIKK